VLCISVILCFVCVFVCFYCSILCNRKVSNHLARVDVSDGNSLSTPEYIRIARLSLLFYYGRPM